jgi:hypothetical protein
LGCRDQVVQAAVESSNGVGIGLIRCLLGCLSGVKPGLGSGLCLICGRQTSLVASTA